MKGEDAVVAVVLIEFDVDGGPDYEAFRGRTGGADGDILAGESEVSAPGSSAENGYIGGAVPGDVEVARAVVVKIPIEGNGGVAADRDIAVNGKTVVGLEGNLSRARAGCTRRVNGPGGVGGDGIAGKSQGGVRTPHRP